MVTGILAEASGKLAPLCGDDKVLRFLTIAFATGAFIGLVCGLAFGGASGTGTRKAVAQTDSGTSDSTTTTSLASSASSGPMTPERAKAIGANEMGQVLVVMYHLIDTTETEWTRTPENFRKDIALLKSEGFYPVNVRDLASGNIDIPAGKSPVVITFDDSSPGQYRILDDGSLDPDSAVGILQEAVKAGDWAARASFFCLLDVVPKERELFGQPDRQQEKLRNLVEWGYEVGSHTVTHLDLKKASTAEATKQLAESQATLEGLIGGGYSVTSLSVPFGDYPASDSLIAGGEYDGIKYAYTAAACVGNEPLRLTLLEQLQGPPYPADQGQRQLHHRGYRELQEDTRSCATSPTAIRLPSRLRPTWPPSSATMRTDLGRPVVRY